ncbi:hypothetical protein KY333_01435 [Candidatus Woesearchaeota archaeon]|nr:hypothetical protein [Candidatus Woesearchaeota archaeon]
MTQKTLTVIFFIVLVLLIVTGGLYLFLPCDKVAGKQKQHTEKNIQTTVEQETNTADSVEIAVDQVEIKVNSLQDLQNTVDFMEQNNIVRNKFLFMKCPDCESGFAIQDCMDLLQDAKQEPEILHMADSIGLDLDNVHRINKKNEDNGIFCYYYT